MDKGVTKTKESKIEKREGPQKKRMNFEKLFFIFVVGCLFGYFYEVILNCVVSLIWNGEFFWERRSGVIYGPFSLIYGAGAVLMVWTLAERKYKWWQLFIYGGLICGVCEYLLGWGLLLATGTRAWDYSEHFMNFSGMTSLPVILVWGAICVIFIGGIYPVLMRWFEKIPVKWRKILTWGLGIFLAIDIIISFSAVIRMGLRHRDVPPFTPYGQVMDEVYGDERMRKAYPSLWYSDN